MSFWSENKNTFKSAGIATVKGIGSGTKALSKAGYSTYKKHDAASKGLPPPGDTGTSPPPMGPATPRMDKEKLLALPAPPRRNVAIHEAPTRNGTSPVQGGSQSNIGPGAVHQNVPQNVPQNAPVYQQSPAPVQNSGPPPLPNQRPQMPLPDQSPPQASPPGYGIESQPGAPPPQPVPPRDTPHQTAVAYGEPQPVSIISTPHSHAQMPNSHTSASENPAPRVPKPAPDASMFAPPPIHKNRGAFDTKSGSSKPGNRTTTAAVPAPHLPSRAGSSSSSRDGHNAGANTNVPDLSSPPPYTPTASGSENSAPTSSSSRSDPGNQQSRAPVRYVEIDVSKFGPPPPRRSDAPAPVSRAGSVASSGRGNVPPPPPRPLSATNTASTPLPTAKDEMPAKPKKIPPPKPAKLQKNEESSMTVSQEVEPQHTQESPSVEKAAAPSAPNFAAEIARLRSQKSETPKADVKPNKPQRPPKPMKPEIAHKPEFSPEPASSQQEVTIVKDGPSKPQKPQKPPKLVKPASLQSVSSSAQTDQTDASKRASFGTPSNPVPKPLVLPLGATPMGDQPIRNHVPGFRVPVKGQSHHTDRPEDPVTTEQNGPSDVETSKPAPRPLAIPLAAKPSEHHVNHLVPGFRVPVKGQFHHPKPKIVEGDVSDDEPDVHQRAEDSGKPSRSTPPPVPPSRNSRLSSTVSSASSTPPPPPPPARNYARAPAKIPPAQTSSPVLDLDLKSGWYANTTSPLVLPASLSGLNYSTTHQYSTRTSPNGTVRESTRSIDVRLKDLSRVVYNIQWVNDNFADAKQETTKFVPSPIENNSPTKKQLVEYSERFGNYVVSWCLHREGQQVGSGECWDLARDALAKGCGKHAFVSQYYHHGYPILELNGTSSGASVSRGPEDEIRPGDILQFKSATLHDKNKGYTQTVGSPDHTSVVYEKERDVIRVLEQNVQGVKIVRKGEYILSNMVSGSVIVYRPVPAEWAE